MSPRLEIRFLGGFCLSADGKPLHGFSSPRVQSLLAYLILHRDTPQPRQWVASLLWPDTPEAQARTNLRKTILFLRQALPEPDVFLNCDGAMLQWRMDTPFTFDVDDFKSALAAGAYEKAVTLYTGDLLLGCYDEWIQAERERLFQTYRETLERLIRQKEDSGDYDVALSFAQQLLQCDPLREEVHRHVMHLYDLKGDRAAALYAYQQCAALLQRELDVAPSPATHQVYEHLLGLKENSPQVAPLAGTFPLVGRSAEWARLQETWRRAAQGNPRLALISGEAGIGKTRLAEELLVWVDRQDLPVSSAHCYAAEVASAYGPVIIWLRGRPLSHLEPVWRSEVARLLPELLDGASNTATPGPLTQNWQRQRFHEALARAVLGADLAVSQPLLLLIEDLQWCDGDTLAWMNYLLRYSAHARLLVVGTLRTDAMPEDGLLPTLLADLQRQNLLTEIGLQPLAPKETTQLGEAAFGQILDAEAAANLYRETEGNPLFIVEFARAGLPSVASMDSGGTADLPPLVQAAVASRLTRLSLPAQRVMHLAAVIGREFTFEVLRRASGQDLDTLIDVLDELWRRRVIREQGKSAYDFSHDKLRQVVYSRLSIARRQQLHRQVAEALSIVYAQQSDAVNGQIGWHYEQAGYDLAAAEWLWKAGDRSARVGAYAEAVAYLKRALSLLPADDPRRAELLCRIGSESAIPYGGDQEMEYLQQGFDLAHQIGDRKTMARACLNMSWAMSTRGQGLEATRMAEAALEYANAINDQDTIGRALINLGIQAYYRREYTEAMQYLERSLVIFRDLGEASVREFSVTLACVLNYMGLACLGQGNFEAAERHWRRALDLCEKSGERPTRVSVTTNLAWMAFVREDYDTAESRQIEAIQIYREIGDHGGMAVAYNTLGHVALRKGQLDAALNNYRIGLKEATFFSTTPMALETLAGLASVWTRTGKAERAAELLGLAMSHSLTSPEVAQVAPYALQLLQEALPLVELDAALQRGELLDLDQVVKETLNDLAASEA